MWRHMGPQPVQLDLVGDGITMKCTDLTALRGSVQITNGLGNGAVVCFKFSCNPDGYGIFTENGTADRMTIASSDMSMVSSSAVLCAGFAQVRMEVKTASGTTGTVALFEMCSYTPNTNFGERSDQGTIGFGSGVNDISSNEELMLRGQALRIDQSRAGGGTVVGGYYGSPEEIGDGGGGDIIP